MQVVFNIFLTILVFGLLILSHEAGHFFTAVWAKIKIHEFSIGMGPALFKREGKLCRFSIRAFPIGGYVQMEGEDGDSTDENSFTSKPRWKRFLVLVMGAVMNILMGFLLICCINATFSGYPTTKVAKFDAEEAVSSSYGLQVNDQIVSIDGYKIFSYMDISYALNRDSKAEEFDVTVKRGNKEITLQNVRFKTTEVPNYGTMKEEDFIVYGVKRNVLSVIRFSAGYTFSLSRSIYSSIGDIFTKKADLNQLSGPVGTATAIGESAASGLRSLLLMIAFISINLGIMNLLPFPALDGGRILLLGIEAIRRKPLNPKIETALNAVGLILLLGLMVVITFKDVINLF